MGLRELGRRRGSLQQSDEAKRAEETLLEPGAGSGWPGGLARRASNLRVAGSNRIDAGSRDPLHRRWLSVTYVEYQLDTHVRHDEM